MIDHSNAIRKLHSLTPSQRIAIAVLAAQPAIRFFGSRYPEQVIVLEKAITACWNIALDTSKCLPELLLEEVQSIVPDSENADDAGPAIPAGEAVICALATASNPCPENVFETITCAFTAFEMNAYLDVFPPDDATAISKRELDERTKVVARSSDLKNFVEFVEKMMELALSGKQPASLRMAG